MCEQCIELANEIPAELLQAIMDIQPHVEAIITRMTPHVEGEMEMVLTDPDAMFTPQEHAIAEKEFRRAIGLMGLIYSMGFVLAENSMNKTDLINKSQLALSFFNKALNEGNALRYVRANKTN